MRTKMTVVRISNMKLTFRVIPCLFAELILLSAMQANDPFIAKSHLESGAFGS